jgi:hypothetical protein
MIWVGHDGAVVGFFGIGGSLDRDKRIVLARHQLGAASCRYAGHRNASMNVFTASL